MKEFKKKVAENVLLLALIGATVINDMHIGLLLLIFWAMYQLLKGTPPPEHKTWNEIESKKVNTYKKL